MAFGDSFDFSETLVRLGISEGKERRAAQKADRRKKRIAGADTTEAAAARRKDQKDRLGAIRTQFGATTGSPQRGKLGEPSVGRRRLTT